MSLSKLHLAFVVGLIALTQSTTARAVDVAERHFTFQQDGYFDGAAVTGAFSGIDLDGNGILVHFPIPDGEPEVFPIEHLELTDFSMHFSGNTRLEAFDLNLDDLFGFVFEIDTHDIGDDPAFDPILNDDLIEGIGTIGDAYFYTSGLGPNGVIGGFVGGQIDNPGQADGETLDTSPNLVLVTEVPEPAAAGLLIVAAGWLAGTVRRGVLSCSTAMGQA